MSDLERNTDFWPALHLSDLVSWAMRTLGKAILAAVAAGLVVAIVAGLTGQLGLVGWAGILAPAAFGWVLFMTQPPLPQTCDDD